MTYPTFLRFDVFAIAVASSCACFAASDQPLVLQQDKFRRLIDEFNAADEEAVVNLIPNREAADWIFANAPLFECPDEQLTQNYYYRWWTFRKHVKQTPDGLVITEFIRPVGHAGPHNTISCAIGHQLAEGRWLRDQRPLDEYTLFWFRSGPDGKPAVHFHKFSSWVPVAIYDRYLVTGDREFIVGLVDELVADFRQWQSEKQLPNGLFWQFDVRDGMEESISGSRTEKNARPTINSYMAANAAAIAKIARLAGRDEIAQEFDATADSLRDKVRTELWDPETNFFKVRHEDGSFADVREELGYIPWMFDLPTPEQAIAWRELTDPQGFSAPFGITTAERRHPEFRTHGVGTCEWDGAVWPFATSQTLRGLANLLRGPSQPHVSRRDFFDQLRIYSRSHQMSGQPYLGEYLDEKTGEWLITGPKAERSRFYNHSTFNDLVIGGLVGVVPRDDEIVEVDPLVPAGEWDWFCLDGVPYHGRSLTVIWDRDGTRYGKGAGLGVWVDGQAIGRSPDIRRLTASLPKTIPSSNEPQ